MPGDDQPIQQKFWLSVVPLKFIQKTYWASGMDQGQTFK